MAGLIALEVVEVDMIDIRVDIREKIVEVEALDLIEEADDFELREGERDGYDGKALVSRRDSPSSDLKKSNWRGRQDPRVSYRPSPNSNSLRVEDSRQSQEARRSRWMQKRLRRPRRHLGSDPRLTGSGDRLQVLRWVCPDSSASEKV